MLVGLSGATCGVAPAGCSSIPSPNAASIPARATFIHPLTLSLRTDLFPPADLSTGVMSTLVEGADFYASPRLSPDGRQLAWVSWDHPNMPWDDTTLWVGQLDEGGAVVDRRKVSRSKAGVCGLRMAKVGQAGRGGLINSQTSFWVHGHSPGRNSGAAGTKGRSMVALQYYLSLPFQASPACARAVRHHIQANMHPRRHLHAAGSHAPSCVGQAVCARGQASLSPCRSPGARMRQSCSPSGAMMAASTSSAMLPPAGGISLGRAPMARWGGNRGKM